MLKDDVIGPNLFILKFDFTFANAPRPFLNVMKNEFRNELIAERFNVEEKKKFPKGAQNSLILCHGASYRAT